MQTREMTTALVVPSPTPLAPPEVVKPHAHEMTAITPPKMTDLICELTTSQRVVARAAESRMMLALTE